jgi:hypothetical protein
MMRTLKAAWPCLLAVVLSGIAFSMAMTGVGVAGGTVTPIMECEFNNGTSPDAYSAYWGYNNTTGSPVKLAIGSSNEFTPGGQSRGQPTSFSTGNQANVFSTNWNGSTSQSWVLDGNTATANAVVGGKPSPACASPPVSITGYQTIVWLAVGVAGIGTVVVWRRRRRGGVLGPAELV